MKKIFTMMAVLAASAMGAFAQKNIDLGVSLLLPQHNTSYGNFVDGQDSIIAAFEISNNGPDAITATDTIFIEFLGSFKGSNTNNLYRFPQELTNFSLASGAKDTLAISFKQGTVLGTANSENVVVKFPHNAHDTLLILAYGVDASGNLFVDNGVDPSTGNISGNNIDGAALVFGTPVSMNNIFGNKTANLSVYPNPSNGLVNVKYNFEANANASINVMDIAGRVVYTNNYGKQNAGEQTFNIDLSNLANGMYTIEMITGTGKATNKFSIKK